METLRDAEIQLIQDKDFEEDVGPYYGKYLGTFLSARGQIRADLFDEGSKVVAWISFPTGRNASNVEDRYVGVLNDYAVTHGFAERFNMVYTES
jgi:nitric oxide synthase oxygenase domain/subunit